MANYTSVHTGAVVDASVTKVSASGVTQADLTKLNAVTSTAAELNILDGVTATYTEINVLDGITANTAELNILDGVTANATELNYLDGADSSINTLVLPDNTTISTFGASLIDDADAASARTTLNVDVAGTDNSTDVTLNTTSYDYLSLSGQQITLGQIDISDDTNLVAGADITLTDDTLSVDDSFLRNDGDDTTSGVVTAAGFIGDVRGATKFLARADVALAKGDAVYISGIVSTTPTVGLADANDASKMPSFGLAATSAAINDNVEIITFGTITGVDTSAFTAGDILYISTAGTTGNTLTATPPSGESSLIQNIGIVQRVNPSIGSIKVGGAGRTNATPNLNDGNIFIGNGSNQVTTASLNTKIETYLDGGTSSPDFASVSIGGTAVTATATELNILDGADADLNTLSLPASTTISTFGASLVDDADASAARTTLGVDPAGTDNSTDVTLAGSLDYLTIAGQVITRNAIDLAADVSGILPVANGGTGASTASGARTNLNVDVAGTDNSTDVTLVTTSHDYLSIAGQAITLGTIDISDDTNLVGGTGITLTGDTLSTTDSEIVHDNLSGFVANEHIDHSTISITAGTGLSGGGDLTATRTLSTNDSEIVHDNLSGFVANEHIDHSGVTITAGSGLTGGGDITTTRTLNVGAGTHITVNADDVAVNTNTLFSAPAFTGTATGVNLTLSGDLTVNGTTTTLNTTNVAVTDNLIELNQGTTSNANDSGILIERGTTGDNAIIMWDESADKFTVGTTTATASATGDIVVSTGTLVANVEGNLTGNVTGNADTATALATGRTISLTGDVTGTSGSFDGTGNVSIAATIAANSVALGTDTTGDYVSTITAGTGLTSTGATSGEGIAHSLSVDASQTQITSVGTLTSLTVSGDATFDTDTLKVDSTNNRVGIGTTSPASILHIVEAGLANQLRVSNTETDATTKYGAYLGSHYTNSEEPVTGMLIASGSASATGSLVTIGGGISGANAANIIRFFTAATNTTLVGTEKMRIDNSGNVGIGTTAPSAKLDIVATGDEGLEVTGGDGYLAGYFVTSFDYVAKFESSDANSAIVIEDSNSSHNYNRIGVATHDMFFVTNNSEAMRINSSGNVGIGTASPSSKLHINGSSNGSGIVTSISNTYYAAASTDEYVQYQGEFYQNDVAALRAGGYIRIGKSGDFSNNANASGHLIFATRNAGTLAEKMRIDSSGNVGIGTQSPGYKLDVNGSIRNYANGSAVFRTESTAAGYGAYNKLITTTNTYDLYALNGDFKIDENGVATRFIIKDTTGHIEIPNDLQYLKFGAGGDGVLYSYEDNFIIANFTAGKDTIFRNLNSAGSAYVTNLFIDGSAERVGIGTTSPLFKLQVTGGDIQTNGYIRADDGLVTHSSTDGSVLTVDNDGTYTRLRNPVGVGCIAAGDLADAKNYYDNGAHYFRGYAGSGTFAFLNSTGLAIGHTSPSYKLDVAGDARSDRLIFRTNASAPTADAAVYRAADNTFAISTNNTERMRIASNGNVGIGTQSPSEILQVDGRINIENSGALALAPSASTTLYSSGGELYVHDAADNVTLLSPHNFSLIPGGASEDRAWSYFSQKPIRDEEGNVTHTQKVNVDMMKLARLVEQLTGEKLVYTEEDENG